ncbi:chemotaxis protein CheA [Siminovitchia sp. FSL W7-1587]|uniref:chemotaxis protein CheA n=1 Tax=Siminovitchia sp. FSL W7-1587 TaxID=2954699 RepID=UPI0030CAB666
METFDLTEFLGVFIDEVDEQLQIMDQEVLALEEDGESKEVIQKLFRAAHTIKGSSATMGFDDMAKLTHAMEHLLDHVRNNRLHVSEALIDLLFKCLDQLRQLKDEIVSEEEQRTDVAPLIKEVQSFSQGTGGGNASGQPEGKGETAALFTAETHRKAQALKEKGLRIFQVEVKISPDCGMKSVRAFLIYNELQSWGEMIQTLPAMDSEVDADFQNVYFLIATQQDAEDIKDLLQSMNEVADVSVVPFTARSEAQSKPVKKTRSDSGSAEKKPAVKRKRQDEAKQRKQTKQTIRVDVDRLEHLMNLVGELVIDQTRIKQVASDLGRQHSGAEAIEELDQVTDHIGRVIGELQESVMKVRMLPIGQLFSRFPRMVRDLSHSLNKEIDLVIEGQETELDRTVIEKIGDPLIHLIRNAVDHGLESTEERIKNNKPEKGLLRINAYHEENQVVITVEDDGAGINPEKIKASAIKKELITTEEAEAMTDEEAIHLIFRPGFSTVANVSDVSGRGVGMDIVRNHIESLNGIIELDSKLGKGTIFKIKLPLTLAIITGLIVGIGERTFIIPMSNVLEIVRVPLDSIQTIKGKSIVVIREQVLPVVWLNDLLQIPRKDRNNRQVPLVIVGLGEKRIALMVDELHGNQEIVVKSLGKYIGKIKYISGATILGDGRVELILEVAGISRVVNDE